jgi:Protein of unknown function (DUF4240)
VTVSAGMDTKQLWQLIKDARAQAADPADGDAVTARAVALLTRFPPEQIAAAQGVLSGLMADSYRTILWAGAYLINGGCSDDGFDYFRGWLIAQGREMFDQAMADPDALAELAIIRLAVARRAHLECEHTLYIPAQAHRAATGEELPVDAYLPRPREPVGGWAFDFDDRPAMARRLPRLTALCWQ